MAFLISVRKRFDWNGAYGIFRWALRQGGTTILTRLLSEGTLRLDPPGFETAVNQLLG
jgi:hypothetical protein